MISVRGVTRAAVAAREVNFSVAERNLNMSRRMSFVTGALIVLALVSGQASAATIKTLVSFDRVTNGGGFPCGSLTLGPDGSTLYGMTRNGGTSDQGIIFSIPVGGGTLTKMASFNVYQPPLGASPWGSLTLGGSTLYGMTYGGGVNNVGTIFSIPVGGGSVTTLASFNGTNGANPYGGLTVGPNGSTLYGMTYAGGANGVGTIFSIPVGGGTPTTLLSFNGTNGANPRGALTFSPDGSTMYGTTRLGGYNNYGTFFSIPTDGGTLYSMSSFYCKYPRCTLTLSPDGSTLYGTSNQGGEYKYCGTIIGISTTDMQIRGLGSFSSFTGRGPYGGLTFGPDGSTLYGMTSTLGPSGDDHGTIYSVPNYTDPDKHYDLTPTVVATFIGANGALPYGDLTLVGSTLYGLTSLGGDYNEGTLFSLTVPEPATLSLLALGGLMALRRRR